MFFFSVVVCFQQAYCWGSLRFFMARPQSKDFIRVLRVTFPPQRCFHPCLNSSSQKCSSHASSCFSVYSPSRLTALVTVATMSFAGRHTQVPSPPPTLVIAPRRRVTPSSPNSAPSGCLLDQPPYRAGCVVGGADGKSQKK